MTIVLLNLDECRGGWNYMYIKVGCVFIIRRWPALWTYAFVGSLLLLAAIKFLCIASSSCTAHVNFLNLSTERTSVHVIALLLSTGAVESVSDRQAAAARKKQAQ